MLCLTCLKLFMDENYHPNSKNTIDSIILSYQRIHLRRLSIDEDRSIWDHSLVASIERISNWGPFPRRLLGHSYPCHSAEKYGWRRMLYTLGISTILSEKVISNNCDQSSLPFLTTWLLSWESMPEKSWGVLDWWHFGQDMLSPCCYFLPNKTCPGWKLLLLSDEALVWDYFVGSKNCSHSGSILCSLAPVLSTEVPFFLWRMMGSCLFVTCSHRIVVEILCLSLENDPRRLAFTICMWNHSFQYSCLFGEHAVLPPMCCWTR